MSEGRGFLRLSPQKKRREPGEPGLFSLAALKKARAKELESKGNGKCGGS